MLRLAPLPILALLWALICAMAAPLTAQEATPEAPADPLVTAEPPMTMLRMAEIIRAIDPEARAAGNSIQFTIDDIPLVVIADPRADRMRAMVPIRSATGLSSEELMRLMQANFDSALDARYAVAQGRLWGVFIHPLSPLEKDQLLSAFVQTIKNQNGRPHLSTVILQHEYTHHFLFSTTRFAMPLWMSEGAAEYFGMTGFRENGDAVLGLRATHRWRDLHMRNSASIEVAPLLDFDPDKPFGSLDPDAFYSRAWLLYHYLSSSEEREGQLRAYWLDILRGVAPMDAANAAFGGVNQLERELSLHWRRPKNPFIEVAADQIRIGKLQMKQKRSRSCAP